VSGPRLGGDLRLAQPGWRAYSRGAHSLNRVSRVQRLTVVLVLNLALVAGLVAVGVSAHSLGVLAEGGDYLLDAAGAGPALLAIRLAAGRAHRGRLSPTGTAALINAGWSPRPE